MSPEFFQKLFLLDTLLSLQLVAATLQVAIFKLQVPFAAKLLAASTCKRPKIGGFLQSRSLQVDLLQAPIHRHLMGVCGISKNNEIPF